MKIHAFCYIIAFIVVEALSADVKTRRRQIWDNPEDETTLMPVPSFRETPDRVTFKQGQMAKLECSVENLGTKKVIWRRKSDPNPLTIGRRTFVDDDRISVEHIPLGPDWHLIIKQVRIDDEGPYECQISSTDRDLRRYVHLEVKQNDFFLAPRPAISISGKTYVEKGQKIRLICNATAEEHSPEVLDWFINGQKLATDEENKVTIQMQLSITDKTISSILEIEAADMDDAGIYVCRTSDLQIVSARVDVLNADTNNVKRGTEKDGSGIKLGHQGPLSLASSEHATFSKTSLTVFLTILLTNIHKNLLLPT